MALSQWIQVTAAHTKDSTYHSCADPELQGSTLDTLSKKILGKMIRASRSYKTYTDISGARLWLTTPELGKQGEKKDVKPSLGTPNCLERDNMTG